MRKKKIRFCWNSCEVSLLEILQIIYRPLNEAILSQGIYLHGCPDVRVVDRFRESGQIEVGIVLVLDVIMGHVSVL